jgi:hypothetical protein
MKIEKQKGKFIVSLTPKELDKIKSEFDGLARLRDDLAWDGVLSASVKRAVKLAALIDGLDTAKE